VYTVDAGQILFKRITAPFDGVIIERNTDIGATWVAMLTAAEPRCESREAQRPRCGHEPGGDQGRGLVYHFYNINGKLYRPPAKELKNC